METLVSVAVFFRLGNERPDLRRTHIVLSSLEEHDGRQFPFLRQTIFMVRGGNLAVGRAILIRNDEHIGGAIAQGTEVRSSRRAGRWRLSLEKHRLAMAKQKRVGANQPSDRRPFQLKLLLHRTDENPQR